MRITLTLLKQHNARMFRRHWQVQGKRIPKDMKSEESLVARGIPIVEATSFLQQREGKTPEIVPEAPKLPENYHSKPCGVFGDSNALLLGMPQAQILLNTLKIDGYPEKLEDQMEKLSIPTNIERAMYQSVMNVCLFDPEQVKLEHRKKDPERPAYIFPRIYGLTDARRNRLLFHKFIQSCEKFAPASTLTDRRVTENMFFKYPFEVSENQLQLEVHSEVFIASKKAITPVDEKKRFEGLEMPNIFPALPTVSIPRTNIYKLENIYPLTNNSAFVHPHTLFLHFSTLDVKHLSDIPVSNTQFESRAIMKAFAVAASKARASLGTNVTDLQQPIVVQTVQSDGKRFQFGIFQLNSLDLTSQKQNYWYSSQIMNLYEECGVKKGKPTLEGYNRDVLKHMTVLYNNS
ncbi:large ribosomal subunit protein mL37 [Culicoides brevitarsis]|uniref:large ribosomal subunit protein mL37 n=1 Tax=Culicoides brevitarsis TaxID=469753 RepID=UPI00307B71FB